VSKSGFFSLYSGWAAYIVLCLKPAITYAVFDRLKEIILKRRNAVGKTLTALEAFAIGAIARGIATMIVFPYTRAKVRVGHLASCRKPPARVILSLIPANLWTRSPKIRTLITSMLQPAGSGQIPQALNPKPSTLNPQVQVKSHKP
jgi:hypothetical protein